MKDIYVEARQKHKPKRVKVLFIGESPPPLNGNPRYFYLEQVDKHDYLFVAMMQALYKVDFVNLGRVPKLKARLLKRFKKDGYFLIDAVEFPLNGSPSDKKKIILENADQLIQRVRQVCHKDARVVLIKANIYKLLAEKFKTNGFNILNSKPLPFPMYQHKSKFIDDLRKLLRREGKRHGR